MQHQGSMFLLAGVALILTLWLAARVAARVRLQAFVDPNKPSRAYVRGQPPTLRGNFALVLTAGLAWLMAWYAREVWQGRPIAWVEELLPEVESGVQLIIGLLNLLAFLAVPVLGGVLLWQALSPRSTVAPRHAARLFVVGLAMILGGIALLAVVFAVV